jgi:hypothetical protein
MRWSAAEYDNSAVHIWRIITMQIASLGIDLGKATLTKQQSNGVSENLVATMRP